jgi:hypothetical protein
VDDAMASTPTPKFTFFARLSFCATSSPHEGLPARALPVARPVSPTLAIVWESVKKTIVRRSSAPLDTSLALHDDRDLPLGRAPWR